MKKKKCWRREMKVKRKKETGQYRTEWKMHMHGLNTKSITGVPFKFFRSLWAQVNEKENVLNAAGEKMKF